MAGKELCFRIRDIDAAFGTEDGMQINFTAANRSRLVIDPVVMSGFSERGGMIRKIRRHDTEDGLSCGIDSEVVIPFGVEPVIRRAFEAAAGHVSVVTDIDMKGGMPVKNISVDRVTIEGKVRRVGIIAAPEYRGDIPDIIWKNCAEGEETEFYSAADPFLVCLVELEDGFIWEAGTGDDLWRWAAGARHAAQSLFRITGNKEKISMERLVYVRTDEKSLVPQRGLRFKWYFAWADAAETATAPEPEKLHPFCSLPPEKDQLAFRLTPDEIPEPVRIMSEPDQRRTSPCFESNGFCRRFNRWIRLAAARYSGSVLTLDGVEPHLCLDAAHLERPKKSSLPHWDIMSIMNRWLWANRQLRKNGTSLRFTSKSGSKLAALPSMRSMTKSATVLENEE